MHQVRILQATIPMGKTCYVLCKSCAHLSATTSFCTTAGMDVQAAGRLLLETDMEFRLCLVKFSTGLVRQALLGTPPSCLILAMQEGDRRLSSISALPALGMNARRLKEQVLADATRADFSNPFEKSMPGHQVSMAVAGAQKFWSSENQTAIASCSAPKHRSPKQTLPWILFATMANGLGTTPQIEKDTYYTYTVYIIHHK